VGEIPQQGRWYIYGIFLPDEALEKVYFKNAQRVLRLPDVHHSYLEQRGDG
jgi:hypothetical protein